MKLRKNRAKDTTKFVFSVFTVQLRVFLVLGCELSKGFLPIKLRKPKKSKNPSKPNRQVVHFVVLAILP
ncbi:hypothetical protein NC653_009599 [Populus alba x Populus x berolinensis]|uniref:Uncharacterized protein n=1 Tax=Populus alba x Populus x berolinensis TaxID=444605 RepID=A0AAD6WAJ9_9ROSI|nr:hypothetical protein NC653_009599 [Populus alba x Populus x berolinensis]